jgi:hypothetical protein
MTDHQIRRIPIVQNGEMVGIYCTSIDKMFAGLAE